MVIGVREFSGDVKIGDKWMLAERVNTNSSLALLPSQA